VKRYWWLIALGLGALVLFFLFTLPAKLIGDRLGRHGVQASAFYGSVWSGEAHGLTSKGAYLGDLKWSISPLELIRARLAGHLVLTRSDGSVETDFDARLSGDLRLHSARLRLPLAAFDSLPLGLPRGWKGQLTGDIDELVIRDQWPAVLRGTLDLDGLVTPPPRNAGVGSYRLIMPDPAMPGDNEELSALVADKEGPLGVDARLTLSPDRSFLLEGTLAPRGGTPPELEKSLRLLGPADAAGRREFSVGGTI
jgi:hypothetical protein